MGIHFMCQCVLSTVCESTGCRSAFSSTAEGSSSTIVRKRGKDLLHPSCAAQRNTRPQEHFGALMPAGQGGEATPAAAGQALSTAQGSTLWGWREPAAPACFLLMLQLEVCTSQKFPKDSGAARAVKKLVTWFQAMVCICIASCCLHMGKFRICIPFAHFNTVCEFTEWTLNSDVAGEDCLLN